VACLCIDGRYRGLRMGYAIPACSSTPMPCQLVLCGRVSSRTSRSMLKCETNNGVCKTEVAFVVMREFADKLLRQRDGDCVVPTTGTPRSMHENLCVKRGELQARDCLTGGLFESIRRSMFACCVMSVCLQCCTGSVVTYQSLVAIYKLCRNRSGCPNQCHS
jgi:hypothetical protein